MKNRILECVNAERTKTYTCLSFVDGYGTQFVVIFDKANKHAVGCIFCQDGQVDFAGKRLRHFSVKIDHHYKGSLKQGNDRSIASSMYEMMLVDIFR